MALPGDVQVQYLKKLVGDARTVADLWASFKNKSSLAVATVFFGLSSMGLLTFEANANFAAMMFLGAAAIVGLFVVTEAWKKVAMLRAAAQLGSTPNLTAQATDFALKSAAAIAPDS